jgi:hypothetical protein
MGTGYFLRMLNITLLYQPSKIVCHQALDNQDLQFDGELPRIASHTAGTSVGFGQLQNDSLQALSGSNQLSIYVRLTAKSMKNHGFFQFA